MEVDQGNQLPQPTGPEERKKMQFQLLILLHAHNCQRRENQARTNGEQWQCNLPGCKDARRLCGHVLNCQEGDKCTVLDCESYRQLWEHIHRCRWADCLICPRPFA